MNAKNYKIEIKLAYFRRCAESRIEIFFTTKYLAELKLIKELRDEMLNLL